MTSFLQMTVHEKDLKKLRDLAASGMKPMVEWSPSKTEVDERAFKKRGEVLAEILKLADSLLEPELLDKEGGK